MTPLLSGTHTLNNHALFLLLKLTGTKRTIPAPEERAAKTSPGSRRQLPREECSPPHLADEILGRGAKRRSGGERKKIPVQLPRP